MQYYGNARIFFLLLQKVRGDAVERVAGQLVVLLDRNKHVENNTTLNVDLLARACAGLFRDHHAIDGTRR